MMWVDLEYNNLRVEEWDTDKSELIENLRVTSYFKKTNVILVEKNRTDDENVFINFYFFIVWE